MKGAALAAIAALIAVIVLAQTGNKKVCLAKYETSLEGRTYGQKINAKISAARLNGAVVAPGQIFSFNRRVGTWSRDQGYRRAPVSYNGTLIASWGGGVCQTSTTLYNAALLSGMQVLERSPHRFAPDYVSPGRDAAVAYDDVDLRFRNPLPAPVTIDARVENNEVIVEFDSSASPAEEPQIVTVLKSLREPQIFRLKGDGGTHFIRNTGKRGCEAWTYRVTGTKRELLSVDEYPVMNKIEEGD